MRESQEGGGGGGGGTVRVRLCARGTRRGFSTPIPPAAEEHPNERTSEQEGGGGEDEDGGGWWRDGEKQRRRDLSSAVTLCSSPLSPAAVRSSHFSSFFSYRHSPFSPPPASPIPVVVLRIFSLYISRQRQHRRGERVTLLEYRNRGLRRDTYYKFASLFNLLNHMS